MSMYKNAYDCLKRRVPDVASQDPCFPLQGIRTGAWLNGSSLCFTTYPYGQQHPPHISSSPPGRQDMSLTQVPGLHYCGKTVDESGTEDRLSCQKKTGTYLRHSQINKIIKDACSWRALLALLCNSGTFWNIPGWRQETWWHNTTGSMVQGQMSSVGCYLCRYFCQQLRLFHLTLCRPRCSPSREEVNRQYQGALSQYLLHIRPIHRRNHGTFWRSPGPSQRPWQANLQKHWWNQIKVLSSSIQRGNATSILD
jgi:hypothetical protein